MDRDMDAIRQIVMAVKDSDSPVTKVAGMPADIFLKNAVYLIKKGHVEGGYEESTRTAEREPILAHIDGFKGFGFEFADAAEDDILWEKVKRLI